MDDLSSRPHDEADSGPPSDDQNQAPNNPPGPREAESQKEEKANGRTARSKGGKDSEPKPKKSKTEELADELAELQLTLTHKDIPIEDISCIKNRAEDPEAFEDLVENLRALKLMLEPIIVRRDEKGNRYRVIDGRRRWHAAVEAKARHQAEQLKRAAEGKATEGPIFDTIPCIVIEGPMTVADETVIGVIANVYRLEESPVDIAMKLFQAHRGKKWSYSKLVKKFRLSKGTISDLINAVEKLPPELLDSCRDREVVENGETILKKGENIFKVYRQWNATQPGGTTTPGRRKSKKTEPPDREKRAAVSEEKNEKLPSTSDTRITTKGFKGLRNAKYGLELQYTPPKNKRETTTQETIDVLKGWIEELTQLL
jgi:hypothetical protein